MTDLRKLCGELRTIERELFAEDRESEVGLALAEIRLLLLRITRGINVSPVDFLLALSVLRREYGSRNVPQRQGATTEVVARG